MTAADQAAAAANLQDYFAARVAEFRPVAIGRALAAAPRLADWLQRACAHGVWSQIGKLQDSDADVLMVGSFSPPTLLVLLLDTTQPEAITVAARNALVLHYLADREVTTTIQRDAECLARRAVQHLATQQEQFRRAEAQSLYGAEHGRCVAADGC